MGKVVDVCVLSIASFLGNVGVALTGFGMAIIYLFVYQIIVLAGYDGNLRYAVFIQALALFSAQPLLLRKAEITKHASWKILHYFIPITIISTPLGQLTGDAISTDLIEIVAGFLVTFVAVFEMYQKRKLFAKRFRKWCCSVGNEEEKKEPVDEENPKSRDTGEETSTNISRDTSGQNVLLMNDHNGETNAENDASLLHTPEGGFFGQYNLGKTLDNGSFSVVKLGTKKKCTRKSFAIKIIDKSHLLDDEAEQLQEEITHLQQLNHPNILYLQDLYDEPQKYFLVFDLMHGGDLLARLSGVRFFSEAEARRIAKDVLGAVRYMHDHRIAHRDLKPENILLASGDADCEVKLADFGFSKKEVRPNSFVTLCGTPGYVAPEILKGTPYGCKVDMWSFGVICWVMLVGYQPFRGESEQEVQIAIVRGKYVFDEEFWEDINDSPKEFITSLLVSDPETRLSSEEAQCNPWFSDEYKCAERIVDETTPVFFMVGSQRSGSNWLRTMLNEREDLGGPHPPHIMREFMPIIDKFGDLSDDESFRILLDHVCTFVERNQVPWTDKHGCNINFLRPIVYKCALESCNRVKDARHSLRNETPICNGIYLLSIFDAIMTYFTKVNGKRLWVCKSMGMSQYHDILLEFYGSKRLRYIYLVRDPRDVAMSFVKTPVGDCHWHAIVTKWTKLQACALRIVKECPELIYKLHYEDILEDREREMKNLYDFIGERRFGGVKRTASVMYMESVENVVALAKEGRESLKAHRLSSQFMNLSRGISFFASQFEKWRHPDTGLQEDAIQILETVAHETMKTLGYEPHLVGVTTKPSVWNDADLAVFERLNQEGISKMNEDLGRENPDDLARRKYQAAALAMVPVYKPEVWVETDASFDEIVSTGIQKILNEDELLKRRDITAEKTCTTKSGLRFRWACGTQRGYYPDNHDKPNQDDWIAQTASTEEGDVHWFSVYDGHGTQGHKCSEFARKEIPNEFQKRIATGQSFPLALEKAHVTVHNRLIANPQIETELSGTTAGTLLLMDDQCIVSNVGDSSFILGWKESCGEHPPKITAKTLCTPHTPNRADERSRIERAGGVVMTADQRDGLAPMLRTDRSRDDDHEPLRIWSDESAKVPGCAFTRTIGDGMAHKLGVVARPELFEHSFNQNDRVVVLASDGVTEFMDQDTCVRIACAEACPSRAAEALIREASKRWKSNSDYMDDITAIVVFLDPSKVAFREIDPLATAGETAGNNHLHHHHGDGNLHLIVPTGSDSGDGSLEEGPRAIGPWASFWTLLAGGFSGFLGGICGIRGPPVILYFLHPPYPVTFDKKSQRATGAVITATNVAMRVAYYVVETLVLETKESYFRESDLVLYLCVVVSSILGVLVGTKLFDLMKDSRNNIRLILSFFLLMCGISLLISSFHF